MRRRLLLAICLTATVSAGGLAEETVTETLIGTPITEPAWSAETRARLEQDLVIARAVMEVAPEREDSHIWLGRRLGYLTRYGEPDGIIDAIPEGLELVENFDYYGIRFFKGTLIEAELMRRAGLNATFGVATVHLIEGRTDEAERMLQDLVAGSSQGYWPAETELLKLRH